LTTKKKKKVDNDTTRVTSMHSISGDLGGTDCLIQIYGDNLGRKYDLFDPICTIGRDQQNEIVLDSDSVSRRHAILELCEAGRLLRDLDSTNGSYLNDIQIRSAVLSNGDLIKVGDTIFKYLTGANVESLYHEEIYNMTISDGLTQISNKRFLMDHLDKEFSRAKRYGRSLSIIMFDIDHFKGVNDQFGHLTGDYVLKELATLLKRRIRKEELFSRYGGEEFVVVLPESGAEVGRQFGEIIRAMVEEHLFEFEGQPIRVTISVGIGELEEPMNSVTDLLKLADENLYGAKRGGRNKVVG
jgi:two-component system, cell cycle response regulator